VAHPSAEQVADRLSPLARWLVLNELSSGFALLTRVLTRCRWLERRAARRCPHRGAEEARTLLVESISLLEVRTDTECGQCGARRRAVVDPGVHLAYTRRIRRDVGRMHARGFLTLAQPSQLQTPPPRTGRGS
jgi:hypothetical protein